MIGGIGRGGVRLPARTAMVTCLVAILFAWLHDAAARNGLVVHGLPPIGTSTVLWGGAFMIGWALMTVAMNLPSLHGLLEALRRVGGTAAAVRAALSVLAVWIAVGAVLWLLLW